MATPRQRRHLGDRSRPGLSNTTASPATGTGSITIASFTASTAPCGVPLAWRPARPRTFTFRGKVNVARGRHVLAGGGAVAATPPDLTLSNNVAFAATRST